MNGAEQHTTVSSVSSVGTVVAELVSAMVPQPHIIEAFRTLVSFVSSVCLCACVCMC